MAAINTAVLETGKRDAKGRQVPPELEWERLLDEYEKSALTQKAFARREGINLHTLVARPGRRRKGLANGGQNKPVRFQEVSLSSPAMAGLEVHLPGGLVLKGGAPQALAALVLALRR